MKYDIQDLAMFIKRLSYCLIKADPTNTLPTMAMEYLTNTGLIGTSLRIVKDVPPVQSTWDAALAHADDYLKGFDADPTQHLDYAHAIMSDDVLFTAALLYRIADKLSMIKVEPCER